MSETNDNLILIAGESKGGKSTSLRNLKDPEGVLYLNCESNRKLTFPAKFEQHSITDPYQVYEAFDHAESEENWHTIVIDTATFLMDMFVSVHVAGTANTMAGWAAYAEYFRNLMQQYVAKSSKNVIFLAHLESVLNEQTMTMEKKVPVKGQLGKNGIEALAISAAA